MTDTKPLPTKPLPTKDSITITKRSKREVRFSFDGANYVLTSRGVVGLVTLLADGREWYSYTGLPYRAEIDLRDGLATGRDRLGYSYT